MGLRINTNVASLAAQNSLQRTSKQLGTSLERLSSGLRINKGADDVVGLLTSENLRGQIRGISVAALNLNRGSNLLGVAEGSLAQLTDVAQKLREKVVQAADTTISAADRTNITNSVSDLTNEYGRLATASAFNGVDLLNGTFTNKAFQIGPNSTDTLSLTISDSRASAIGKVAILTSITITGQSKTSAGAEFADPSGITINSVALASTAFTSDGVSKVQASESALAYVTAINSISGQTKVTAQVLSNIVTLATYSGATDVSATDSLYVNGVLVAQAAYSASSSGADSLVTAINNISVQTGVSATNDTTASAVVLTAADGRNVDLKFSVTTTSTSSGVMGLHNVSGTAFSFYRGTFKLFSDLAFTLGGATAEISATTSIALSDTTTLSNVDTSTAANATTAIFILDNVIRGLQNRRADVGSKAIRFDVALAELSTRQENLSASESSIRDADIAAETANLTKNQILQQAGVSVLQRANSLPQIALSLLQS